MLFPFPDPESALTLDAIVTQIQTLQGMVAADSLTQSLSTCEGQREGSAGQGWSWYGGNVGFLYLPKHLFIPFSPIFDTPKLWDASRHLELLICWGSVEKMKTVGITIGVSRLLHKLLDRLLHLQTPKAH